MAISAAKPRVSTYTGTTTSTTQHWSTDDGLDRKDAHNTRMSAPARDPPETDVIILFDIPATVEGVAWSPNIWKTRYV